jgi:hypothetical protein
LDLLFNQTALPVGSQLGDYTLLANVTNGAYVLTNNTPPPSLLPGARYFLGVQNTDNAPATFALQVDTQVLTNTTAIALTNAIAYTNTNAGAIQYYSFDVPSNAILASFEIVNPAGELDLYARHALPLPSATTFDYQTAYAGTNDQAIVVTTNSAPVPLTPGTWYLAVDNPNPGSPIPYRVVATYITNGGITVIPLTNFLNGAYTTNGTTGGTAAPGPALTNFYSYTVTNPAATAVQFVVSNLTGNVDLLARNGALPTPQQMTDGSFNPANTAELITIATNALLPALAGTTWYLGVPNNTAQTVTFLITASTLTNAPPPYTFPAVVVTGVSLGAGGFTLQWAAVPGAQYQVAMTADLLHWTNAAAVTPAGSTGAYYDPTPVRQQSARFYQVLRTH